MNREHTAVKAFIERADPLRAESVNRAQPLGGYGNVQRPKKVIEMVSEFPTLDLLGRYDLRTAYVLLMLGARSQTHFQNLHDEVIPLDCRLPRNLFIELKHERERMMGHKALKHGMKSVPLRTPHRESPSDEVLLREFDNARKVIGLARNKATLTAYYESLLRCHSLNKFIMDAPFWNGIVIRWDSGDWDSGDWDSDVSCMLNSVPCRLHLTLHLQTVPTLPPEGITLPKGHVVTKAEKSLRMTINISRSAINHLWTPALLELPKWNHMGTSEKTASFFYSFEFPDPVELPELNTSGSFVINEAKLEELLAYLRTLGLPFELIKPV